MGRGPTFGIRALDWARRRLARQDGFTMIEVMVAVLLLTVGVIGSVRSFDAANAATGRTKAREGGTNLAREVIEATRSIPYSKVLDGSLVDELQAQPGLGDARSGGGWEVRRRNITYTIDTSVCVVDDERDDGLGPHDPQAFCGAPGGTADVNPDDYKRVTVEVSWAEPTARGQVRQSTLMANPGTPAGPAVSDLSPETESPITTPAATVRFNVRTDTPAATVAWSVDGNHGGDADGSDTSWSFDWQISSLYDGAYLVSAQGFDQFGTGGAPRVYTMDLNRFAPLAPPGFTGGWSGSIVEFEWLPNAEGDIEGYRVYRQGSGPDELVCGLSTSTTCRDPAPPNQSSITYYVVAVDRDPSGNLRQGAPSTKPVTK